MDTNSTDLRQIITEIGKQLLSRKKDISSRSWTLWLAGLSMAGIYLLFFGVAWIIGQNFSFSPKTEEALMFIFFPLFLASLCAAGMLVYYLFYIEKIIWIDSYFDGIDLSSQKSFKIAKKIFWPYLKMDLRISAKYYLLPWIIGLMSVLLAWFLGMRYLGFNKTIIIMAVLFVATLLYTSVYIQTKKYKFAPFIFLDRFGQNKSYASFIEELERLNNIHGDETFVKALITKIGVGSLAAITGMIASILSIGIANSAIQKGVETTINLSQEFVGQIQEYSEIVAFYILYRYAREQEFGFKQEVNLNLYGLADSE